MMTGRSLVLRSYANRFRFAGAFTLVELLVSIVIIATLASLTFGGWKTYTSLAARSKCSSNLRQLAAAVNMYVADHHNTFPPYVTHNPNGSRVWYFGYESSPPGTPEGDRDLDVTAGPLYPYIQSVGKIEVCSGFSYGNAVYKPKFKGASYGYGYNWWLGGRMTGMGMNIIELKSVTNTILFGDCAQVNTFQPPASASNPKLEEFYIIDQTETTVHFRHAGRANMLFVDGHVESMLPFPNSLDKRMKTEKIGRITKKGSYEYLK